MARIYKMGTVYPYEGIKAGLFLEPVQHFCHYQAFSVAEEKFAVITDGLDADDMLNRNNNRSFAGR